MERTPFLIPPFASYSFWTLQKKESLIPHIPFKGPNQYLFVLFHPFSYDKRTFLCFDSGSVMARNPVFPFFLTYYFSREHLDAHNWNKHDLFVFQGTWECIKIGIVGVSSEKDHYGWFQRTKIGWSRKLWIVRRGKKLLVSGPFIFQMTCACAAFIFLLFF